MAIITTGQNSAHRKTQPKWCPIYHQPHLKVMSTFPSNGHQDFYSTWKGSMAQRHSHELVVFMAPKTKSPPNLGVALRHLRTHHSVDILGIRTFLLRFATGLLGRGDNPQPHLFLSHPTFCTRWAPTMVY